MMKLTGLLMVVIGVMTTPHFASAQSVETAVVTSALREMIKQGRVPDAFSVSPYALVANAEAHAGWERSAGEHSRRLPDDLASRQPCRLTTAGFCELAAPGETTITYSAPQIRQGLAKVTFLISQRLTSGRIDSRLLEVALAQGQGWEVQEIRNLWHGQSK
jgi:hypothetical protein